MIEETLKRIEESANLIAEYWNCLECKEGALRYIPFDDEKEMAGIEYCCLDCGSINSFFDLRNHYKNGI